MRARFFIAKTLFVALALASAVVTSSRAVANATLCPSGFAKLAPKRNPQLVIWELEAAGRHEAANRLRAKVEESLRSAKIVNPNPALGHPEDAQVVFVEFADGRRGVAKTWVNNELAFDEGLASRREALGEILTYQFDRLTGANIVPVTVERKIRGQTYFVQLFVRDTDDVGLHADPHTLKLFDYLTYQADRIHKNHLTAQGRTIAIDNGGAFDRTNEVERFPGRDFPQYIENVLAKFKKSTDQAAARAIASNEIGPSLINREFVEKLKTLTDQQWSDGMPKMSKADFKAFLIRKNKAVKAIEKAEAVLGDSIYPAARFSGLVRESNGETIAELEGFLKEYGRQVPSHIRRTIQDAIDRINSANLRGNAFMSNEDAVALKSAREEMHEFKVNPKSRQEYPSDW